MSVAQGQGKGFALKLLASNARNTVSSAPPANTQATSQRPNSYSYEGLMFDTIWLQGAVESRGKGIFAISDGTGTFKVSTKFLMESEDVQHCQPGDWVTVIGEFRGMFPTGEVRVIAHKFVTDIKARGYDLSERLQLWQGQATFLATRVYPNLAARPSQQPLGLVVEDPQPQQ